MPTSEPIEPHLRGEPPPDDLTLVVRGGPITHDDIVDAVAQSAARFTYHGQPLRGFSVEGVNQQWPLERVLTEGRIRNRDTYATVSVGELREVGCNVLDTFRPGRPGPPHYTVTFRQYDETTLARVVALLRANEYPNVRQERR